MNERYQYIQKKIEELKQQVEMKNKVVKLCDNPDFKSTIIDFFCTTECARYTGVSTDPNIKPDQREDALRTAQSAGIFKRWLNVTIKLGEQAEQSISEWEKELVQSLVPDTTESNQ
jgi:hypothetical protein